MTVTAIIEWFQRPQKLKKEIEVLQGMLDKLTSSVGVGSIDYGRDHVKGGNPSPSIERLSIEKIHLEKDIQQRSAEYAASLADVISIIHSLTSVNSIYAALLQHRFIDLMPWADIQQAVFISRSRAFALYNEALRAAGTEIEKTGLNRT